MNKLNFPKTILTNQTLIKSLKVYQLVQIGFTKKEAEEMDALDAERYIVINECVREHEAKQIPN